MSYIREHSKGLFGTISFHIGLIVLLLLLGFKTPLPLPAEEGILINFGTDNTGSGLIEPSASSRQKKQTIPEPAKSTPVKVSPPDSKEKILTQDTEEAPSIASGENKKKEEKPDLKAIEAQKKREAELEKQRLAELERKRQEELERKRKEEEQRKIQEIQNRTRNAFATGKNDASNTSTSEGITSGQGNQGGVTGSVNSKNYQGTGLGSNGVSFSLEGRSPLKLPLPEYKYQVEGKVVVEVTVDRNGKVTKATAGVKGSTTLDENLLSAARKAALAAQFNTKPDAPAFQKGTITYHFMLQ